VARLSRSMAAYRDLAVQVRSHRASFDEIRKSSIPEDWKGVMYSKLMKTEAETPGRSFGMLLPLSPTGYLRPRSHLEAW